MTATGAGPARVPGRKQLIINATLRAIVKEGVAGLALRQVAQEADVALGSISYYFGDKDGLLSYAFQDFTDRSATEFGNYFRGVTTLEQARSATVTMLKETAASRTDTVLGSELYALSLRRPRHRVVLAEWTRRCRAVLGRYFDSETTFILDALYEGLILHRAMHIGDYNTELLEETVHRITPPESFIFAG